MYIFVYGTLKKEDPNHALLKSSRFIHTTKTVEKYIMLDLGLFPGVLKPEDASQIPVSSICGEVYDINEDVLRDLDTYEGKWYYREQVRFENGLTALMYFLKNIPPLDYTVIPNGNWLNKKEK